MNGIRIVTTYNCNIMCSSCKYKCGPHKKGIMDPNNFYKKVEEGCEQGFRDYLIIDGGEPMLHSDMVYKYLKRIDGFSGSKYVVTNGYWGNQAWYYNILEDLKRVGLDGVIFEYDYFHSVFIEFNVIRNAIKKAAELELDISLKAVFTSGDIKENIDRRSFEYVKSIRREFENIKLIMNEVNDSCYPYRKSLLVDEKLILYSV